MHDTDRGVTVVYNGELHYFADLHTELTAKGHQVGPTSYAEVLLSRHIEWCDAALNRVEGPFFLGHSSTNATDEPSLCATGSQ
jgi:asparagine synthetase B (glutamine-hydrolysing)